MDRRGQSQRWRSVSLLQSTRARSEKDGRLHLTIWLDSILRKSRQIFLEADVAYLDRAPQSIIAEHATVLLNNMSSRDWEKNFTSVLNSVMKEEHLDPILRITLLQRVLKVAATGSSATC